MLSCSCEPSLRREGWRDRCLGSWRWSGGWTGQVLLGESWGPTYCAFLLTISTGGSPWHRIIEEREWKWGRKGRREMAIVILAAVTDREEKESLQWLVNYERFYLQETLLGLARIFVISHLRWGNFRRKKIYIWLNKCLYFTYQKHFFIFH